MRNNQNKTMNFALWLGSLRRRWWLISLCMFGALIPILIYNHEATPIFRATTKVIFEQNVGIIDLEKKAGNNAEENIFNQIEEIKTKSFARDVYSALPDKIQKELVRTGTDSSDGAATLGENLTVEPTRDTEILAISFESPSPKVAQTVANAGAQALIDRNLGVRRQKYGNVKDIIDDQFTIVRDRLQESEADLKQFKETHNITSLEAETEEILKRVTEAEILYNQVGSERRELQEKLNVIQAKLASGKKDLSKNVMDFSSPIAVRLKERVMDLETRYSNLQVQGLPLNHPKMLELQEEIARTKESLVAETRKMNNQSTDAFIDPFLQMQQYMQEANSLELELQAAKAKHQNLRALLEDYNSRLRNLPEREMTLVRLMRERDTGKNMYMRLSEEGEMAGIKEAAEIPDLRIIEPARLPESPVQPRKALNLILGGFSGLLIGILFISGIEYFKDAVKTEEDVEEVLRLPVIASIPRLKHDFSLLFDSKKNGSLYEANTSEAIFSDEFNLLCLAVNQKIKKPCVVMVTSSIPGEGKSTLATMLALTSAQRGEKTLLIDADLRRPRLHRLLNVPRQPGLTNLAVEFAQIVKNSNGQPQDAKKMIRTAFWEGIIQTPEKNLLFLPCGYIPANPLKLWSFNIWNDIFRQLKTHSNLLIIDAPPIIGISDASIISSYVDYILFCVESENMDRTTLQRSFKFFRNAVHDSEHKMIGAILNKIDLKSQYGKYKYYRYYTKKYHLGESEVHRMDYSY
jgi:capsular exopolysaccharide synthesis family protein